ncbi:MAG: hypothetical protein AAGJ35_07730, partial [Myxococcota bacterium]
SNIPKTKLSGPVLLPTQGTLKPAQNNRYELEPIPTSEPDDQPIPRATPTPRAAPKQPKPRTNPKQPTPQPRKPKKRQSSSELDEDW